ncbi:MAG: hypothetical protein B7Y51_00520 [Burkholderiales bacterium 28-67-8]|nr:MAG: hypothetical protein B7Y51_00520 [Burkholderiales bacterium 28-67-8]
MYLTRGHLIALALAALVLFGCEDTPIRQGSPVVGDGARCREFSVSTTIGGQPERTVGTACQQADGSWRVQP